MNKAFLLLLVLFLSTKLSAQINPADSTVQVVAYWDKNEKHTFNIVQEKLMVKDTDSVIKSRIKYTVDITVKDSTAKSYTVEWKYRDYKIEDKDGKAIDTKQLSQLEDFMTLFEGQSVIYKTNENGEFIDLVNWKEIKKRQQQAINGLIKKLNLPSRFKKFLNNFNTKEAIQQYAIKDIMQFHNFYGVALELGKPIEDEADTGTALTGQIKSEISLTLEEIDFENSEYVVKFLQSVEKEALNKVVGNVMAELLPEISSEKISELKLEGMDDYYGALIHDSGWPVTSYFERTVTVNGQQTIERRTIELVD